MAAIAPIPTANASAPSDGPVYYANLLVALDSTEKIAKNNAIAKMEPHVITLQVYNLINQFLRQNSG